MDLLRGDPEVTSVARLELERDRVCERLRSMSLARLGAELSDGRTRAAAAAGTAQLLADVAAGAVGEPERAVPALPPHAMGDVIAVMANDLLRALPGLPAGDRAMLCERAVAALVALRLNL